MQTVVLYRWPLHGLNCGHVEKGVCRDIIMVMWGKGDTTGMFVWSFCRQYYRYTYGEFLQAILQVYQRGVPAGYAIGICSTFGSMYIARGPQMLLKVCIELCHCTLHYRPCSFYIWFLCASVEWTLTGCFICMQIRKTHFYMQVYNTLH